MIKYIRTQEWKVILDYIAGRETEDFYVKRLKGTVYEVRKNSIGDRGIWCC